MRVADYMAAEKKESRFSVGDTVRIGNAEEIQQTLAGDCTHEG